MRMVTGRAGWGTAFMYTAGWWIVRGNAGQRLRSRTDGTGAGANVRVGTWRKPPMVRAVAHAWETCPWDVSAMRGAMVVLRCARSELGATVGTGGQVKAGPETEAGTALGTLFDTSFGAATSTLGANQRRRWCSSFCGCQTRFSRFSLLPT